LLPIALSLQYADTRAAARQHPRAAAATDEHSSPRHGLPTPFENSREDISLGQRCSGRGNPQGGPQKAHQEGDTRGPDVHLSTVVLLGVPDLWRHVPVDKHAVIQDLLALSDELQSDHEGSSCFAKSQAQSHLPEFAERFRILLCDDIP